MACHIDRITNLCVDGEPVSSTNPLPTSGGAGPGSNVVVTDMEDGAGDSVMDPVNDAVRVNVVAGGTAGGVTPLTYTAAGTLAITSGGTSQEVFAANASRKALLIINISSEVLWVAFGGAATADTPSIPLQPNNAGVLDFPNPGGGIVTQQIQIIGATTGSKFVALQSS
jgi:hypothetical protein